MSDERLADLCIKLRASQLRCDKARDTLLYAAQAESVARTDFLDEVALMCRWANRVLDELIVPSEVPS